MKRLGAKRQRKAAEITQIPVAEQLQLSIAVEIVSVRKSERKDSYADDGLSRETNARMMFHKVVLVHAASAAAAKAVLTHACAASFRGCILRRSICTS